MATELDDKTEQPTDRRRRLAREAGQGPRSVDLTLSCRMLGIAVGLQLFGEQLCRNCGELLAHALQHQLSDQFSVHEVMAQIWEGLTRIGISALGCCVCVAAAGLAGEWFQVGLRFQVSDLQPDLSRLGPARSWNKLWSLETATQAAFGLLKYAAVVAIGGWYLWSSFARFSVLLESDVVVIAEVIGTDLVRVSWQLAGISLAYGLTDYGYQVWKFEQSLKMTPAELREEVRQQGGDPHWKRQREELWRQLSQKAAGQSSVSRDELNQAIDGTSHA